MIPVFAPLSPAVTNLSSLTASAVLMGNTYHYIEVGFMSITSIRIADDVEKPLEALSKKLTEVKIIL